MCRADPTTVRLGVAASALFFRPRVHSLGQLVSRVQEGCHHTNTVQDNRVATV